jgi:hypothetical protein
LPATFFATVQACDQYGRLITDRNLHPVLERVSFARSGELWELMALTNQTDHVIRLNTVTIRLFDSAANQLEPLSKDDLSARLMDDRPCPSSQQAANQFRAHKVFDRNIEIVPGTTATFWVVFHPPSRGMPGGWKFAIYDVPVQVDEVGRPTKTTRFEMRVVVTQFIDTYTRASLLAGPRLIETKEAIPPTVKDAIPPTVSEPPAPATLLAPTRDMIARVQTQLKAQRFDPGPPDGELGPKTREALRRFQNARRLQVTGALNTATLEALGIQ